MHYKETFQLAQSKGYIPTDYTLNENGFHGYLSEDQYYLEMCFIQKWLRDVHEIIIEVSFLEDKWYGDVTSISREKRKRSDGSIRRFPSTLKNDESSGDVIYEEALLRGIHAALQII